MGRAINCDKHTHKQIGRKPSEQLAKHTHTRFQLNPIFNLIRLDFSQSIKLIGTSVNYIQCING